MCVMCLLEVCCRDLCAAHPWLWFVRWDNLHWPNRSARCNASSQQLYQLPAAQPVSGPQILPQISVWLPAQAWFWRMLKLSTSPRCSPNRVSLSAGSGGAAAKCTFWKETWCGFFWLASSVESIKCGHVREISLNAWPVREAVLCI